jgi:hypothetical protein
VIASPATLTPLKSVGVVPPPDDPSVMRLLQSLSAAFAVRFVPLRSPDEFQHDALLILADDDASLFHRLLSLPAVFSAPGKSEDSGPVSGPVCLAAGDVLPPALRGQTFGCALTTRIAAPALPGLTTLARLGDRVLWAERPAAPGCVQFRSNLPLQGLAEGEEIIDALQEWAFIALLPLVEFLRRVVADDWRRPPPRATLIIDDPNLHSGRYGRIDFAALAHHARQVGFHACMATIPFDTWWINPRAVAVFREAGDVLSLAVHGNDHEYMELAQTASAAEADRIVAQVRQRLGRAERRSGLPIARVMVPPHGALSDTFLGALGRGGFHGATTTRGAIWEFNGGGRRAAGSGLAPAEIVRALPIVHRFRFTSDRWRHRVALAAYLGQPIVTHGHHQDFAGSIGAFDAVAGRINELEAKWMNLAGLFASNYEFKCAGDLLQIRPYSRQVVVPASPGCSRMSVDLRGYPPDGVDRVLITAGGAASRHPPVDGVVTAAVPEDGEIGVTLEARSVTHDPVTARRTRFTSALRRVVSEGRDRFLS